MPGSLARGTAGCYMCFKSGTPCQVHSHLFARRGRIDVTLSGQRESRHPFGNTGFLGAAILVWTIVSPRPADAQSCASVTIEPTDESATILVTDSAGTCEVPDGGYIKVNTVYKRFISASLSGSCQTRVTSCSPLPCHCVDSLVYTRYLANSALLVDSGSQGNVNGSPTHVQNYSTCTNPPACTNKTNTLVGGASWTATTLGPHVYTSSTSTYSTPCVIQPTTFPQQQSITMNALKCEPKFLGDDRHLEPTTIEIYLPPAMIAAQTALEAAAQDWNGVSTGVTLQVTSTSCGDGPNCVTVSTGSIGSFCGLANANVDPDTGLISGNASVTLQPTWDDPVTGYSAEGLQRTFAHELGHLLGLDNYDAAACGVSDAAMQDQFACQAPTVMHDVTVNDSLPTSNSVYGEKSKLSCGF